MTLNATALYGFADPKDAKTIDALSDWLEVRNWLGRSFCVFEPLAGASLRGHGHHTTSTLPFPVSLTVSGKDSSSPVVGSSSVRKAWCGLLGVLSSVAVKRTLRVSVGPRERGVETAEDGVKLVNSQSSSNDDGVGN